jgi:hypothetical protein
MIVVLMDTRRHRTLTVAHFGRTVGVWVDQGSAFRFECAEFTFQGDYLRGDPIYLQTSGPELPARWWDQS